MNLIVLLDCRFGLRVVGVDQGYPCAKVENVENYFSVSEDVQHLAISLTNAI